MAEKKSTKGKTTPKKRVAKAKLLCTAKLSDGSPCPKTVEQGKLACMWHNPEDEAWGENYVQLLNTPPEQKRDFVLSFIKAHPEHELVLPVRNGQCAYLQGADLSNIDIQNADLFGVNLQDADLRGTNLSGAFLDYAYLIDANLENANLQEARLTHARLQSSNLRGAKLISADLKYTDLNNAHLENADCKSAKFLEANLQGADLQGASLQEADLIQAKLQGAYLNRAKLMGAHLEEANLQGTKWGGAILRDAYLYAADLRDADLSLADLTTANLNGANLQGANLHLANLKGADLSEAKLQGVDLSAASDISNIFLSGAWLDRTRISLEKLSGAVGEELNSDYSLAKRAYLGLKQNFDDLGDYEASSWAYCKERRMEKLEARENGKASLEKRERHLPKKLTDAPLPKGRDLIGARKGYSKYVGDTIVELLCDYGESVWRVIGWLALILFIVEPLTFSLAGGFYWDKNLSQEFFAFSTPWSKFLFSYWLHILYSLSSVGTSGFSGFQPANLAVDFASSLFSIVDIFLVGLLGFVAGNRIRRS